MTDIEVTLNAWEQNYVQVLAVQGESEGRTIVAALIDRTGQTDQTFNAASVNRPINLADTTARLYCIKPDGTKTFSDGTVTDAANGKASFVLPYQATAAAGEVDCQVLLTKPDGSTLKTIGLTLNVQASSLEGAAESTSEFSALVTALGKADAAAEQTEQAKTDSKTAVANANTAIGNINTKNQEITAAESARVTSENGRVAAENTRVSQENARKTAETTRQSQEGTRQSQESTRQTNETARGAAETTRSQNEDTRNGNEAARKTAEQDRAAAEADRQTHEADRRNVEDARVGAEQNRATAETARAAAETTRQQQETTRQTQETGRVNAESARVTAENQRQTDTQTAISGANTARDGANTAATRANTAAQNAEDAIAGQLDPAIDARIAAKTGIAGGIAGYDSASAHYTNAAIHITTLACTKSGTNYALTGLTATSGEVAVRWKTDAAYAAGDTVTIDGTSYTLKTTDGSALTAGAWAAGAIITGTVDVDAKTLTVMPSAPVGAIPVGGDAGSLQGNTSGYRSDNAQYIPIVSAGNGPLEIGKYIDFHEIGSTTDFDTRLSEISAGGGLQVSAAPAGNVCIRNIVYNTTPSSSYLGDGVLELIPK